MVRFAGLVVGFLAIGLLAGVGVSQDKKTKGVLPAGMSKIGLSKEQKAKIYDIQAKYHDKIKALEEQMAELKSQRQGEYFKVLTKDQQEAYLKALTGGTKTETKKPDDDKK